MVRIQISLEEKVLTELDKFCNDYGFNRSECLRDSFRTYKRVFENGLANGNEQASSKNYKSLTEKLNLIESMLQSKTTLENKIRHDIMSDINQLPEIKIDTRNIYKDITDILRNGPQSTPTLANLLQIEDAALILIISKMKGVRLNHDYDWELM